MESGFPRPIQVRDARGWHDGWVTAARRGEHTGRWRGFVNYIDRSGMRTGAHYIQWADQDRNSRRTILDASVANPER